MTWGWGHPRLPQRGCAGRGSRTPREREPAHPTAHERGACVHTSSCVHVAHAGISYKRGWEGSHSCMLPFFKWLVLWLSVVLLMSNL